MLFLNKCASHHVIDFFPTHCWTCVVTANIADTFILEKISQVNFFLHPLSYLERFTKQNFYSDHLIPPRITQNDMRICHVGGVGGEVAGGASASQKFWFVENPGKFGHRCFDILFWLCEEWHCLSKYVWIWYFSPKKQHEDLFCCFFKVTIFCVSYVAFKKRVFIIFEIQIFRASLRKFRQKSFAPPKFACPCTYVSCQLCVTVQSIVQERA